MWLPAHCRLSGSIGFKTVAAYGVGCAIRSAERREGKYASWTNADQCRLGAQHSNSRAAPRRT
jgi:hypothetical protein